VANDFTWRKAKTGELKEKDPFARRPCQPAPFINLKPSSESKATEKKEEEKKAEEKKAEIAKPSPRQPVAPVKREDSTSAIHESVDLDLDIDISGLPSPLFDLGGYHHRHPMLLTSTLPFSTQATPATILPRPAGGNVTGSRLSKGFY